MEGPGQPQLECSYPKCIIKGALYSCWLCKKPCCIQHMELVRLGPQSNGIAAECRMCFKAHPESKADHAVWW